MQKILQKRKGFTLVELLVSISIFVFMTALLIAKYGNFNNGVLFTNLAYDIALTIRTAQTYGLSVQGQSISGSVNFQYPYGVVFCAMPDGSVCTGANGSTFNNKKFILFSDTNNVPSPVVPATDTRGAYDGSDLLMTEYLLKRGAKVNGICVVVNGTENCTTYKRVDISFQRPNPDAVICASLTGIGKQCSSKWAVASGRQFDVRIRILAPDGSVRFIHVKATGEVSIEQNTTVSNPSSTPTPTPTST